MQDILKITTQFKHLIKKLKIVKTIFFKFFRLPFYKKKLSDEVNYANEVQESIAQLGNFRFFVYMHRHTDFADMSSCLRNPVPSEDDSAAAGSPQNKLQLGSVMWSSPCALTPILSQLTTVIARSDWSKSREAQKQGKPSQEQEQQAAGERRESRKMKDETEWKTKEIEMMTTMGGNNRGEDNQGR